MAKRISVHLRLSPELYKKLLASADERDISINLLSIKAIEFYLDRLIPIDELVVKGDN
jgi:predicted HicB family RNase H-like nuclease